MPNRPNNCFPGSLSTHPFCNISAWVQEYNGRWCQNLAKVETNGINCSPFIHKSSHFIIEGKKAHQVWFIPGKSLPISPNNLWVLHMRRSMFQSFQGFHDGYFTFFQGQKWGWLVCSCLDHLFGLSHFFILQWFAGEWFVLCLLFWVLLFSSAVSF